MTIDAPGGSGGTTSAAVGAARTGANWIVFVAIAALVVVLDQASKAWLAASVSPGQVVHVAGDLVRLVFSQNSGALFGFFRDNAVLFGIVSLAVVGMILLYHGRSGRSLYLSISLGLLLGGALGNMADRLRLGYVIDWVDIGVGDLRWYTFNVADAAISIAIVMIVLAALFPTLSERIDRRSDG
jgi:signal peptidase II